MRARIDISEIEAETKIRAKYLRALENEEWDLLPGPTFVKTFLRTYAEALGLDAKLIVEEYKLRHERASDNPEMRPIGVQQQGGRRRPQPQGVPRGYIIGLAVVLVVGTLYLLGSGGGDDDEPDGAPTAQTTTQVSPGDDEPAATIEREPEEERPATTAERDEDDEPTSDRFVRLQIVPTGPVYVCLEAAGNRRLVDGLILDPSSERPTYRSSRFRITLGNDQVRLRIDGENRSVPAIAEGVGYEITRGGKRRRLDPGERPVCG